jgi:hypothetical protein
MAISTLKPTMGMSTACSGGTPTIAYKPTAAPSRSPTPLGVTGMCAATFCSTETKKSSVHGSGMPRPLAAQT